MRRVYSLLGDCTVPLMLAYLWWRGRKDPHYRRRWGERFGLVGGLSLRHGAVLVHCGSVGEVLAARPLIDRLLAEAQCGPLIVTCSTPTGTQQIHKEFGDRVGHVYFPLDLPGTTRRFLRALSPRLVILLERELWPNFLHQAQSLGVPVVVVNARRSTGAAAGYARWHRIMRPALGSLRLVCCEDQTTADRFAALGVSPERLRVTGNIKSDLHLAPTMMEAIGSERAALGARPVLAAGSTHAGEDEALIAAFPRHLARSPHSLLILVPRHPERFEAVADLLQKSGLRFARRSLGQPIRADTQVLLGDTMGELMHWYGLADACFVGGSLIPRGGHNPLEVLALDKPLIAGPHTHNFAQIYDALQAAQALLRVANAAAVFDRLDDVLRDRGAAAARCAGARTVYESMAGATRRTLAQLADFVHSASPQAAPLQLRQGADTVWVHPDCFEQADARLFDPAWWQRQGRSIGLDAGRGHIHQVSDAQRSYLLRHYYRGGLMARLSRDLFMAQAQEKTRGMAEFALLGRLRARGLPVPRACAARLQRLGPCYRADILVALIPDAQDVAWLLHHQRTLSRAEWQALGHAVRRLHDEQVFHADLNCHNLMLDVRGKAWIVDFDKCGFRAGESWKADNLARLLRSLRKELRLDPALHWSEAQWKSFLDGYNLPVGAKSP